MLKQRIEPYQTSPEVTLQSNTVNTTHLGLVTETMVSEGRGRNLSGLQVMTLLIIGIISNCWL